MVMKKMKKKYIYLLILLFTASFIIQAQNDKIEGITSLDEFQNKRNRSNIIIPKVKDFYVLKCDFHMHTVFSDGLVWPSIRVLEAWMEGLDAIAITEHIEHHPFSEDVITNPNRPFEIAKESAKKRDIILIKGCEITRHIPPGHFNAIFIGDASNYITGREHSKDYKAIMKAVEQNAFIFWAHPGLLAKQKPDSHKWIDFVDDLYKKEYLKGVEVFNNFTFDEKALDWCVDKNLTVLGSSDIHGLVSHYYKQNDIVNRSMTLVFAKERTKSAIKEALLNGRTVAWSSKYIAGKEKYVRELFNACVDLLPKHHSRKKKNKDGIIKTESFYKIKNNSSLYFELKLKEGDATKKIILEPNSSQIIVANDNQESIAYTVTSTYVRSNKHLEVKFDINSK